MRTPRTALWIARTIAVMADLLQLALFPLFAEGFLSPLSDVVDVLVAIVLVVLVGWHWAFLPTFLIKEVPMLDLAPTWTIAVMIATRNMPLAENTTATAPELDEKGRTKGHSWERT